MSADLIADIQKYQERFVNSKHGWFSLQAAITTFDLMRRTPIIYKDLEGNNVIVTAVTRTEDEAYNWPDKVYVGRVVEYVGHVDYATFLKEYYYSLGGLLPEGE